VRPVLPHESLGDVAVTCAPDGTKVQVRAAAAAVAAQAADCGGVCLPPGGPESAVDWSFFVILTQNASRAAPCNEDPKTLRTQRSINNRRLVAAARRWRPGFATSISPHQSSALRRGPPKQVLLPEREGAKPQLPSPHAASAPASGHRERRGSGAAGAADARLYEFDACLAGATTQVMAAGEVCEHDRRLLSCH
jgi:hypothetical protein